jgi:hypothetical protein
MLSKAGKGLRYSLLASLKFPRYFIALVLSLEIGESDVFVGLGKLSLSVYDNEASMNYA